MRYLSHKNQSNGYTLLFAVLVASLVLGVAAFIIDISRKQFILSSLARDSLYSFYAADSGVQCALADGIDNIATTSSAQSISCDGISTNLTFAPVSTPSGFGFNSTDQVYSFSVPIFLELPATSGDTNPSCVSLEVWRGYDSSENMLTVMQSRGYNTCAETGSVWGPVFSPETVERALQVTL